jgi:hypothetical protein
MGLDLRRVVLQYPRLGWQVSTGITGSFQSESVATFDWNRRQVSTGISGNFRPEYAIRRAFHPENGPLTDMSLPKAEREALCHYLAGAFGYYKTQN